MSKRVDCLQNIRVMLREHNEGLQITNLFPCPHWHAEMMQEDVEAFAL
jgi:hypothetical protein